MWVPRQQLQMRHPLRHAERPVSNKHDIDVGAPMSRISKIFIRLNNIQQYPRQLTVFGEM